jgi:hypothetical protein
VRGAALVAALGMLVALVALLARSAPASAAANPFTCVVLNLNACKVTIPLTSNMNEQVGSTMPDLHPWYLSHGGGSGSGYTLTGETWNGSSVATRGTAWADQLTTGASVTAGSNAQITFRHVTPITAAKPYSSISVSYPSRAATGSVVTVTSVVHPVPAKGHLVLQRSSGSKWANVVGFAYNGKSKHWTAKFKWIYPSGASRVFRALAVAAPGLSSTPSGTFLITTSG